MTDTARFDARRTHRLYLDHERDCERCWYGRICRTGEDLIRDADAAGTRVLIADGVVR